MEADSVIHAPIDVSHIENNHDDPMSDDEQVIYIYKEYIFI